MHEYEYLDNGTHYIYKCKICKCLKAEHYSDETLKEIYLKKYGSLILFHYGAGFGSWTSKEISCAQIISREILL